METKCPYLVAAEISGCGPDSTTEHARTEEFASTDCMGSKCELYTQVYTTESITVQGCAVKFVPMMNADGRLVV